MYCVAQRRQERRRCESQGTYDLFPSGAEGRLRPQPKRWRPRSPQPEERLGQDLGLGKWIDEVHDDESHGQTPRLPLPDSQRFPFRGQFQVGRPLGHHPPRRRHHRPRRGEGRSQDPPQCQRPGPPLEGRNLRGRPGRVVHHRAVGDLYPEPLPDRRHRCPPVPHRLRRHPERVYPAPGAPPSCRPIDARAGERQTSPASIITAPRTARPAAQNPPKIPSATGSRSAHRHEFRRHFPAPDRHTTSAGAPQTPAPSAPLEASPR